MVRAAQPEDSEAIASLSGQLGYPVRASTMVSRLQLALASEANAVLVAELGSQVVGWTHVVILSSLEYGTRAELYGLVVDDRYRGQGIGKALMTAAEDWTRSKGLPSLRLRTNIVRADAHAFYERIGYERVKEQRVYEKVL